MDEPASSGCTGTAWGFWLQKPRPLRCPSWGARLLARVQMGLCTAGSEPHGRRSWAAMQGGSPSHTCHALPRARIRAMQIWPGIIRRYRDRLPLPAGAPAVTLLEGNTPLIPVPTLAELVNADQLYIKFEGLNPTGSFKDRGMTVAVSEAVHRGIEKVICASTGNTAASAAAYAARAGIECLVLIPSGKVASGKLAGAAAYGARIVQIEGSFDDALEIVRRLSKDEALALVNSLNPFRIEGQKTVAFEIAQALGSAPDLLALPVGNAGNITAAWQGFRELAGQELGGLPRLLGVQARGAAPLVVGHPIEDPTTIASAIQIGRPARGEQALRAASESGGRIIAVEDERILAAQELLARQGIWVEPASASGLAGIVRQVEQGLQDLTGQIVVCICTGHGLKDPDITSSRMASPDLVPPTYEAVKELLST